MVYSSKGEDEEDRDSVGGCNCWHYSWSRTAAFSANDVEKTGHRIDEIKADMEYSGRFLA